MQVTYGVNCYISEQNFLLPEGVALNRDLKENLFAMLITTQTKLASCILGSPGRGKTLAFEVLVQNLRGAQSPKEFCKRFRAVDPFFYQCSPDSKAAEIEDILSGATRREQMYEQHGGKERCVPFFDEAQLPQECRMVMKPLHDVLDERQVATIMVSGSPLDAANMNRMSIFIRHTQTLEDFMEIGLGVLGKSGIGRLPERTHSILRGLARAFVDILADPRFRGVFSQRHFISLLRNLRLHCVVKRKLLTPEHICRAVEENFQAPDVSILVVMQIFCQAIAREFPASSSEFASAGGVESLRGCLDLARACIFGEREQCLTKGSPHLAPRFCIVLDDMKDDSACRILVQEEVLPEEIEVIDVQDYSNEADDFSCSECVSQMTLCMESGKPVLLRNCSSGKLLCSFYNLLNQNYRVTESAEGQQILYIMIAHGPRVHYCRVHPSFLLVLQMRKEDFLNQPAALRSRFSVVSLPLEQVLHERLGRALARDVQRKAVRTALDTILELVSKLGARSFAGLVEHTVDSLLLSMVSGLQSNKRCLHEFATLCSEGLELNASTAVQVMAVRLLQLLPPEQMVNHASKLGHADFYRNAYFLHQSHFSLVSLLATARTNAESSLPKLVLYTRSSAEIRILQQSCGKNTLWESGGSEHVIVIDAGEVSTTASLEVKLQGSCAEACSAHAVLLVVDMEHSSNERVSCLRTVVDRKARENPSTLFAVLLHYAPEQVIAGSLYPCLFLDGWDFFFIDSLGHCAAFDEECLIKEVMAASAQDVSQRKLRIFSEAQSQEKYVVDFCRRVRTVPSRSLRPRAPEPRPENSTSVFSFSSLAATVGRGMGYLFNQIRTGSSDEQKVQRFYVPEATRQERTSAVTLVLHKHPQIWQHLLTTFHDSLPKPTLHGQLIHLAQQVRDGRRLMSFTDALRLQLHGEFRQHATSYLRALCANGGLRTLIADDHGVATSLLPFLPVCSQTGTASDSWLSRGASKAKAIPR